MTTTLGQARMVVTAAWGHGNDRAGRLRVPAGWVGVAALPDGQGTTDDEWFFLMPESEYNGRPATMDRFVIDPACHPVWLALPAETGEPVTVMTGSCDNRFEQPLYGAAAPHQGKSVGTLWRYSATGERAALWRAYRHGAGTTSTAYTTREAALAAVGLSSAPYAAVEVTPREPRLVFFLDASMCDEFGYQPSVVVEGQPGHTPCKFRWGRDYAKARAITDDANAELGHSPADVRAVIASSRAARR